jgi:restriction endonuclease S subunit
MGMGDILRIGDFLHRKKIPVVIEADKEYSLVTVKLHHNGVVLREKKKGAMIGSNMYKLSEGDFILSGIDARNGAFGIVPPELDGAIVTNDFWCFDVDEKEIKKDFFYWFTNTPIFLDACQKASKGETQRIRLQKDAFYNIEFSFPPINEQEKFLVRFRRSEKLLIGLDNESVIQSALITKLRQSILQEAIEGKLAADWRKTHPVRKGNPEYDATALLTKIRAEKQKLIAEGKIRKEKPLAPVNVDDTPFALPEGWVWTRLGELLLNPPRNGYSPKEVKRDTGIKSLKLGATTRGIFNPSEFKFIEESIADNSIFWLMPNDILIQRSNSIDYVGVSAIYTGQPKEYIYPDLMMKLEVMEPLSVFFVHKAISSPLNREYYRKNAKGVQKSMPKITQGIVSNTLIPLPPLAEQRVIVERVEKLLAMVDNLETQVRERKGQAEMLLQAVLREAFEGERKIMVEKDFVL